MPSFKQSSANLLAAEIQKSIREKFNDEGLTVSCEYDSLSCGDNPGADECPSHNVDIYNVKDPTTEISQEILDAAKQEAQKWIGEREAVYVQWLPIPLS